MTSRSPGKRRGGAAGGERAKAGHSLMEAWSNDCGITHRSSRRR